MPRIRSLVTRTEVDEAQRSHNCQGNRGHRINRGDKRLKVIDGRGHDHYCIDCAKTITKRDIERLEAIARQLESDNE